MSRLEERTRRKPVSVINWMLTILLSIIPGLNIIGFIAMIIFAKNRSKKTFATASLILILLAAVLFVAAFIVFGDQIVEFAKQLNVPE